VILYVMAFILTVFILAVFCCQHRLIELIDFIVLINVNCIFDNITPTTIAWKFLMPSSVITPVQVY